MHWSKVIECDDLALNYRDLVNMRGHLPYPALVEKIQERCFTFIGHFFQKYPVKIYYDDCERTTTTKWLSDQLIVKALWLALSTFKTRQ